MFEKELEQRFAGEGKAIETKFAPSGRALPEDVRRQVVYFSGPDLPRQLVDAVPDFVAILNTERQIVYANKAFLETFGAGNEQNVIGLRPGEALHCEHSSEIEGGCGTTEFCEKCGSIGVILDSQCGVESVRECSITRTQDVGGGALDLRVWATPFEFNNEMFTILAMSDIGDEKRRRALEHIFFHDILNSAGLLQGAVEMMDETNSSEFEQFYGIARRTIRRLIEEIKAQQMLLQAENDELVVQLTQVRVAEFLRRVINMFATHKDAGERHIRIDPRVKDVTIVSDPVLLGRVIGNLVKNALEASPSDADVTLGYEVIGEDVQFWVHNPTFMPRDVQLQVFQRSFSTKEPGRGLGTYSIKLLSERYLHGSVSFTTSREEGTTFRVKYPLNGYQRRIESE